MRTRIDYLADKYCFTELNESPRLRLQWQDVLEECRQTEAGPEERLRIALLNVDYVTSFELPFRLLLTRTPQMIAALREEWDVSQKPVNPPAKKTPDHVRIRQKHGCHDQVIMSHLPHSGSRSKSGWYL